MNKYILGWILLTAVMFGQTGNIKGRIIDAKTKQPLVGANVILIGTTTGAATDDNGYYLIQNVDEKVYKIKIDYLGYHSHVEPDIRVIRGKTFFVKEIEISEAFISSDEVTVTSGYFNESIDMPISNYSYTKEEIVRAPGAAGDIFRAIDALPGVTSSGGEFSSFSVRGGSPKDNIILIDNIPFSSISHMREASGDEEIEGGRMSIFTTGLIEKARFQAGGFGAKYGGKRASLLDLSIKEGNKESFSLTAEYGILGWELNYDGPTYVLENTSMILSARRTNFKNIFDMMGNLDNGHVAFDDYIFKITSNINKNHRLSLLGIYATESSDRDVFHLFKAEKGELFNDRDLRKESEDNSMFGLNWQFLTSKQSYLNTSIYLGQIDQDHKEGRAYCDPVNGAYPTEKTIQSIFPLTRYYSKEKQSGLKTDFTIKLSDKLTLNSGLHYQRVNRDATINLFASDTLYEFDQDDIKNLPNKYLVITPDEMNNSFNKTRNELALYTEGNIKPADKLNLNIGLRFEYDDLSEQSHISPRFSGSYKLNSLTSINFAAGLYFQLPELAQLASHSANIKIKKEKSTQFVLGITHYLSDELKLTAEGYYKKLSDLIVQPETDSEKLLNNGKGYAYGLDLSIMKRFVNKMYGQINYSYAVSKIEEGSLGFLDSDFNQPHIFNVLVGYQFNDNWSISAKWKYASGRPRDEFLIYGDVLNNSNKVRYSKVVTAKNKNRYIDFHALNVRVDYRKQFSKHFALIAYLDVMNAYDRANNSRDSFNQYTGINEKEGLELLPTLGVKLEF